MLFFYLENLVATLISVDALLLLYVSSFFFHFVPHGKFSFCHAFCDEIFKYLLTNLVTVKDVISSSFIHNCLGEHVVDFVLISRFKGISVLMEYCTEFALCVTRESFLPVTSRCCVLFSLLPVQYVFFQIRVVNLTVHTYNTYRHQMLKPYNIMRKHCVVAQSVVSDLRSKGRGFESRPGTRRKNSGHVSHTYVPLFTKQYKLVPAKGR